MRKRIVKVRETKYIRVASCNASSLKFFAAKITAVIIMCVIMCACNTSERSTTSWETYCAKYNVDEECPTVEQENFYLDCYAGSVEEEQDLGL